MKKSEYYKAVYPLEELIPKLDEIEIRKICNDCDYTYEVDKISKAHKLGNEVNITDAVVFYEMGYQAVIDQLEKRLIPIEVNEKQF